MAVVHLYGPKPRLSIYNVVKWSLRVNWVQYEPNLRIHLLGICTYANTPILAPWTKFWPHGPNFDQISQIRSVISYLGQKKLHLTVKSGPVWKFQIFDPSGPPKPKIGPPRPRWGPGTQKRAWIILVQSNNDHWWQKINFGKGQLFLCFFHLIWPNCSCMILFI